MHALGTQRASVKGPVTGSQARCSFQPVRASVAASKQPRSPKAVSKEPLAIHSGAEISISRRDVLAGLTAASAVVVLPGTAQAAATCDFIESPSGLQYCDIQAGEGPEPVKGSLIRCHYTGRLASNNRVFDSSYERGRPLTFKVGVHEVIQGWDLGILGTEGIPSMKEGGKRLLLIPAELGYGARGAGGVVPPNASLLFEVELLGKPGRR